MTSEISLYWDLVRGAAARTWHALGQSPIVLVVPVLFAVGNRIAGHFLAPHGTPGLVGIFLLSYAVFSGWLYFLREEQLGRGGRAVSRWRTAGWQQQAECGQTLLGCFPGGVEGAQRAAAATRAAQHFRAEGPLVEGGPVDAGPWLGSGCEGGEGELAWSYRCSWWEGDDGTQRGVMGVGAVEGREVKFGRWDEGEQPTEERLGGGGEEGRV